MSCDTKLLLLCSVPSDQGLSFLGLTSPIVLFSAGIPKDTVIIVAVVSVTIFVVIVIAGFLLLRCLRNRGYTIKDICRVERGNTNRSDVETTNYTHFNRGPGRCSCLVPS